MKKSLHGIQTITDGCWVDINKSVKKRYQLTNTRYRYLKEVGQQKDLSFGKLCTYNIRKIDELNNKIIEKLVSEHTEKCFPKITVVTQSDIEEKTLITGITTDGATNYQMYNGKEVVKTKMRSYKNSE